MEYIDDPKNLEIFRLVDSNEKKFYIPTNGLNSRELINASARTGIEMCALRIPTTIELSEEGILIKLD